MQSASTILNGKALSDAIKEDLKSEVALLNQQYGITPCLCVILIGDRSDSKTYVRMKQQACELIGIKFILIELPTDVKHEIVLAEIKKLNENPDIHAILVQHPWASPINENEVFDAIVPHKNVDGFGVTHMGCLAIKTRTNQRDLAPCTALGCIELLDYYKIPIDGKRAVVIGRSQVVGMPVFLMLTNRNATVTLCHTHTQNLPDICKEADILVVAIGQPLFVKADWIKPGATVIDVGMNTIPDQTRKSGTRLVGDVDFDQVKEIAGAITPVPGGVGPMTVAMLLKATVKCAKINIQNKSI